MMQKINNKHNNKILT